MGQRSPHFEWQTGEEEWQTSPALGMRPRQLAGLRDWPLRWRLAAVTLLVCVLGGGGWLWYRAESGLAAIREELATAVQTEFWSAVHRTPGWTAPKDGETSTTWQAQFAHESVQQRLIMGSDALKRQELADVQVVVLHNDIAAVHIVTSQQSDGQLYRQTRFYRHTDKGWQRTMPDESLWGTQHSLESNYFIVNY